MSQGLPVYSHLRWYQIILLGDRDKVCKQFAQLALDSKATGIESTVSKRKSKEP